VPHLLNSIVHDTTPSRRGTAAIEFALAAPMFLILFLGLVEIGFGTYQAMQVQDAAEAGALYASEYGWNPSGISAAVVNATGATGLTATPASVEFCGCPTSTGITAVVCTATCTGGVTPGTYVKVSAALPHQTILSYPGLPLPATLTGQSTIRLQ
jgi:Flp pilus assembly protein TadG